MAAIQRRERVLVAIARTTQPAVVRIHRMEGSKASEVLPVLGIYRHWRQRA